MTYIRLEQAHTDDARWLDAGADAFAVHVAALVYCDRQLLDGCISRPMALRVSLAVPPDRAGAAVEALLAGGFWTEVSTGYLIENYGDHAFPSDQIRRTRERWSHDKKRRRQHDVGDHSLCKDPKFCPAIRGDSTVDSTGGGSRLYQTQPDQTQPEGLGLGTGAAAAGSAGAPPARLERHPVDLAGFEGECDVCPLPIEHPIHAGMGWEYEGVVMPERPHPMNLDTPCCPWWIEDNHPIHISRNPADAANGVAR